MSLAFSLEELAKNLFQALPQHLDPLEKEIEQAFHEILQATLDKLNLVTRQEFDVQVKVLIRTREKVEALETRMQMLLQGKTVL